MFAREFCYIDINGFYTLLRVVTQDLVVTACRCHYLYMVRQKSKKALK